MKQTILTLLLSGAVVWFTATAASAQTLGSSAINQSAVRYWTYQPANYSQWRIPSTRYYRGAYYRSPTWRYNYYRYPSYYRYNYPYSTYYRYPYSGYYGRYYSPYRYYRYPGYSFYYSW